MTRVRGLSVLRRSSARADAQASPLAARTATHALRLVEVASTRGAVALLVELEPEGPWSDAPWAGADVRLGAHLVGADGSTVDHDGPRSAVVPLRFAGLRPPVVWLEVPRPRLDGVAAIDVDVVVEGVAWGSDKGVETLRIPRDGAVPAGTAPRLGGGVAPWPADLDTVVAELAGAWPAGADPASMRSYATTDAPRFVFTAQLLLSGPAERCLEIGSNPYFTTRLLRKARPDLALHGTNWFGTRPGREEQVVVDAAGDEVDRFSYDLVDVERHTFPFDAGAYDTVLFGEVIEHLIADPVHAVTEIHRVLRAGGRLILTTPNVARAENRIRLAGQGSIYDPYSSFGPHGRHNREYSAAELFELLDGNGFEVQRHVTRPVHGVTAVDTAWYEAADDDGRGDYHFIEARRGPAPAEPHRPAWLYR